MATPWPTARRPSSPPATSGGSVRWPCLPTASGWRSRSRIALCVRTSTSCRSRGGEERHVSDDSAALLGEQRGVDGRRPISRFYVSGRRQQRHRVARRPEHDDGVWACRCATRNAIPATAISTTRRKGSRLKQRRGRTPAAAAGREPRRRRRSGSIGAACRGARASSQCLGALGGLTPAPEGHSVALSVATRRRRRTRRRGRPIRTPACTSSTSRAASSRACHRRRKPRMAAADAAGGRGCRRRWRRRQHGLRARRTNALLPIRCWPVRGADQPECARRRGGKPRQVAARRARCCAGGRPSRPQTPRHGR